MGWAFGWAVSLIEKRATQRAQPFDTQDSKQIVANILGQICFSCWHHEIRMLFDFIPFYCFRLP